MSIVLIIIVVVLALAGALVGLYNNLVKLRNMVDNAWAQVDVQLQRRLDLIPNIVETVKGYASHESGTFEAVTKARTACMNASTPEGKMEAENVLTGTLKSLFAVAEAYPELKANTNFQQLQSELTNTEDKISYMRQSYNDTVMKYNTAIQTFPAVLVAGMFGFTKRESFDADAEADNAPKVDFGTAGAPAAAPAAAPAVQAAVPAEAAIPAETAAPAEGATPAEPASSDSNPAQ